MIYDDDFVIDGSGSEDLEGPAGMKRTKYDAKDDDWSGDSEDGALSRKKKRKSSKKSKSKKKGRRRRGGYSDDSEDELLMRKKKKKKKKSLILSDKEVSRGRRCARKVRQYSLPLQDVSYRENEVVVVVVCY